MEEEKTNKIKREEISESDGKVKEEPPAKKMKKTHDRSMSTIKVEGIRGIREIKDTTTVAEQNSSAKDEEKSIYTDSSVTQEEEASHKENVLGEPIVHKKVRRRKKLLHAAIRTQMEFYFSDANLSKDRFMQNALQGGFDKEIPLEVFMNFNKLRALTDDVKEISKALQYSKILKLSEDGTKVSRTTPLKTKSQEDIDLCTVYVEHLPPDATIEWVTKVFADFGTVAYVSLPKFRDGAKIKGFAFVEFNDPESAVIAIKAYQTSDSSFAASLVEDPGKLCSIQAYNAENQFENPATNSKENELQPIKTEDLDETEPQNKKIKIENEESEEAVNSNPEQADQKSEVKTEKSKKQKKRSSTSSIKEEIDFEAQTLTLQVLSKKEWKKLRNKYIELQRKSFRQMMRMKSQRQAFDNHSNRNPRARPFKEEYETKEIKQEPVVKEEPVAQDFEPGLIVKIVLDEPISDAKRFKAQVKNQEGVSYVEAQDCNLVAFVRCTDAATSKSLVEKNIWSQSEVLQGEEEIDYWRKIEENRFKKRDKSSTARSKKSGAERAKQKKFSEAPVVEAQNTNRVTSQNKNLHIRFDDDDD